jgi:hypothetical protein
LAQILSYGRSSGGYWPGVGGTGFRPGHLATFDAYYDTAQNITWLADANYAQTMGIHL